MPSRLEWKGDELKRRTGSAVEAAIADVTDAAARRARGDHGWESRSGETEASIGAEPVRERDGQFTGGIAIGVPHGRFLEGGFRSYLGDRTLARAAEATFASLASRIRAHMERRS